jgi:galactofuranosylgalactofuranosylrhamnosyl-N-acetylglucosaminyl-diphospho-decaprenol beta-1,5/1,6-galactofuranosyltransferase
MAAPISAREARPADATSTIVAQRGLFRGPTETVPADLYGQVTVGTAERARDEVTLDPQSRLSTNTYFGRFPASYWQRWTVAESVSVRMSVAGTGRVRLTASDVNGESRTVDAVAVSDDGSVELSATLDAFLDGGALWVEFETESGSLTVRDLRWTVAAPERQRLASVVICTYNRVEDCLNTLTALGSDPVALQRIQHVYVIDQGSDKVNSRERFAAAEAGLVGRLRYIQQPNLGGAGGFGRGMYEVVGSGTTDTDVLLMDDDVLLDPELVVRVTSFANRTTEPTLIGGQMLRLLHPSYLFAGAEWADMAEFAPGRVKEGALDDVDLLEPGVDLGERRIDADYNAWWSCLIPAEVIAKIGYPLPVFFQWDDIEFGYRAKKNGFVTVTLPGAGLWHADFDWKDLDEWNRYFSIRNAMICASLHSELDTKRTVRVLFAQIVRYLIAMQYGLTATVIKAAEDYLAGPSILRDGGSSIAADIRKMRAEYPDTIRHPVSEVPRSIEQNRPMGVTPRKLGQPAVQRTGMGARLVLLRRLASVLTGRGGGLVGSFAADESFWWHVSQFDTAVVTDSSQTSVRIRKRDRATMIRLFGEGIRLLRRLPRELPAAKREWQAAAPELTSRDNWTRLYQL